MAIDFSQVKTVTIPEGSVCEITDSTGNLLWEGVGWHTIWKGSKTCSVDAKGSTTPVLEGAEDNFAQAKSGTGYTPKIRITFTRPYWANNSSFQNLIVLNNSFHYAVYGSFDDYLTHSPITIEAANGNANSVIYAIGFGRNTSYPEYGYAGIRTRHDTENNRIIFDMYPYASSNITSYDPNFIAGLTVTKIEQYY